MMMRKTLLAMALMTTAGVASLGALAAPPAGAGNTPTPIPPGAQYGQPPQVMPLPPFPRLRGGPGGPGGHGEGFCHGSELFCASMASENPADSLQKLTSILPPAAKGVHYQVRVAVVAIPDHGPGAGDEHGGKSAPKPGQNAPQP
ncbi:hypothetical protein [Candidatus Sodalis sp. SoCistrobi]|uniref:hypothetical protein n=1 Tax=Candidatus Sodalis sp. SoCistrobi TaxID=1922216 RepID=UPI00093E9AEC